MRKNSSCWANIWTRDQIKHAWKSPISRGTCVVELNLGTGVKGLSQRFILCSIIDVRLSIYSEQLLTLQIKRFVSVLKMVKKDTLKCILIRLQGRWKLSLLILQKFVINNITRIKYAVQMLNYTNFNYSNVLLLT